MRRLPCALIAAFGCSHASVDQPAPPVFSAVDHAEGVDDERLKSIVNDHWSWTLQTFPEFATRLGDHRFDGRLTEQAWAAVERRHEDRKEFLRRARALDGLSPRDRVTQQMLVLELEGHIAAHVCRFPLWSLSARSNPITELNYLPQAKLQASAEGAAALKSRYEKAAEHVRAQTANLRRGLEEGLVPNAESTRRVLEMVRGQLGLPESKWPMMTEAESTAAHAPAGAQAYLAELEGILAERVRPALEEYAAAIETEILPRARTDADGVGLSGLSLGPACYRARIEHFTTLDATAEDLHRTGKAEIARINAAMRELGRRELGHDDLAETLSHLRRTNDPLLYFDTKEAIVMKAESALARAKEAIPRYFGRLPQADCVVSEIPAYEAPFTTVAYYRQPVPGGERPGEYFINTYQPETRTRYEAEALAFHESIPGHHLQIAIAQELPAIPAFRRHLGMTAFVEGWALYAEQLADEMGLYSGDLDRLGQLSYEAWRAARLVVDTGIHQMGWTRKQAQEYMMAHTALAPNNIDNEVDRYIVWPGQALAYKAGQLEISRLRKMAEQRLGSTFDVSTFHDVVLGSGAVSLPLLRERVVAWFETVSQNEASP